MALNVSKKKEVIVLSGLNPEAQQVIKTYTAHLPVEIHFLAPQDPGVKAELSSLLSDQTAAVVIQYPDFFGRLRLTSELLSLIKASGALSIVYINDPVCLGLLEPPEPWARSAVGEFSLWGYPFFGGPTWVSLPQKEFSPEHARSVGWYDHRFRRERRLCLNPTNQGTTYSAEKPLLISVLTRRFVP